jgi:hypothetical protein
MARNVEPPKDAEALAQMLSGQTPPTNKPLPVKKRAAQPEATEKLPAGRMGQPCNRTPCKGKLTDLSRAHIAKTKSAKGRTVITLICDTCSKVQAQADVIDLD